VFDVVCSMLNVLMAAAAGERCVFEDVDRVYDVDSKPSILDVRCTWEFLFLFVSQIPVETAANHKSQNAITNHKSQNFCDAVL
jgi:hypothetical protein